MFGSLRNCPGRPSIFHIVETLEQIKSRIEAAVPGAHLEIIPNDSPSAQRSLLLPKEHAVAIARVTSQDFTDTWAKAGVMFRDSTDADSMFAMTVITPGNGVSFQWRSAAGGSCGSGADSAGET